MLSLSLATTYQTGAKIIIFSNLGDGIWVDVEELCNSLLLVGQTLCLAEMLSPVQST